MFTYNSAEEEEEGRSLKPRILFVIVLCVAGKMAVCALDDAIDFLDRLIDRFSVLQNPLPQCSVSKLPPQNDAAAASSSSSSQNSKLSKNADPRKEAKSRATPKVSTKSESIASQSGPNSEAEEMFSKAQIQVGCVLEVSDHPAAEKLFLCKVEVAKGVTRQVVAGLRKFLSPSELEGRKVCVVCNLKPAKLAGQLSEAMILAGEKTESTEHLIVEVLDVPPDASVGERILIEGTSSLADPVKQLSSKIWDKIVSLFKVEDEIATFDGKPLVTTSGCVRVPGLLNGSIH